MNYKNHKLKSEPDWIIDEATNVMAGKRAIAIARKAKLTKLKTTIVQDGVIERTATVRKIK